MRPVFLVGLAGGLLAAAPPAPQAVSSTDDADRPICRRIGETGSYVRARKVCRTAAEWREARENQLRDARGLVEHGTSRPNGPGG